MPGNSSSDVVPLPADSVTALIGQICQARMCGDVYEVNTTSSPPNTTCYHDCLYSDGRLQNCSQREGSNCAVIKTAVCGKSFVCFQIGDFKIFCLIISLKVCK